MTFGDPFLESSMVLRATTCSEHPLVARCGEGYLQTFVATQEATLYARMRGTSGANPPTSQLGLTETADDMNIFSCREGGREAGEEG